jgi:endonuclease/exonuclease/phosphatase family metal-dependent hydrolase
LIPAWLSRYVAVGTVGFAAFGVIALLVSDRWPATKGLLYVPAFWVGISSIVFAILAGRLRPAWPVVTRRVIAGLGMICALWDGTLLMGFGGATGGPPEPDDLTVLHWNVQWGGGRPIELERWRSIVEAIVDERPDVVLLSESPPDPWVAVLLRELGPEWTSVGIEHPRGEVDWYKLVILSRKPIRDEGQVSAAEGRAIEASIGRHRFLLVDHVSTPRRWRVPFLLALADDIERAERTGQPYDVVAGDFNTPARSVGFAEIERAGYSLASRARLGWRATWPSFFPILDIDHVWVSRARRIKSVKMVRAPVGDHLGQLVVIN